MMHQNKSTGKAACWQKSTSKAACWPQRSGRSPLGYIYIYIYSIYLHIYTGVHIYIYIYICIYVCICLYTCMYEYLKASLLPPPLLSGAGCWLAVWLAGCLCGMGSLIGDLEVGRPRVSMGGLDAYGFGACFGWVP